ncbi:ribosome biogenesis protein WDR12 [Histomonas meleagridis]|uniref:ribosome biogenesis protein WDR12-like n=1 Tax=Histomonas meleagridis TaxID=135588 RepID=UPI00355A2452|nr:ribosome biogenesis protein WDR12 [Histomonas meleagridis]KAH0800066.1 ribosome biogenesis protein WDR12-like [Histomonas meleagridis]
MSGETVRIKFLTKDPKLALPQGDFDVSGALNRKGLSDALNQVFQFETPIPFDFKIYGNFLRQSLSQAIQKYGISTENVIPIEFFPAFKPPTPVDEGSVEAWISSLKIHDKNLLGSLYDGSIFLNEQRFRYNEQEQSPLKCVSWLGANGAVAGDLDGCVTYFDFESNNHKKFTLHNDAIYSIATYPSIDHLFVTGCADGSISMWSTSEGGSLLSPFVGHSDTIQTLQWVDQNTLVSASLDRTIRFWDVNAQQEKSLLSASCGILTVAVRGPLIITGHPDRSIRLWDIRSSERRSVVNEFKSHTNWVSCLTWVNDELFASGGYDGAVKYWNIGTEVPLGTISQHDEKVFAIVSSEEDLYAGGSGQTIHHYKFI